MSALTLIGAVWVLETIETASEDGDRVEI